MKKIFSILSLVALSFSLFASKGLVITQKYSTSVGHEASVTVTWYITEMQCKLKMEYSDKNVQTVNWFIPDLTKNALLTYTEGAVPAGIQKIYFSLPIQIIEADKSMNASRVGVTKTGETKTISGMPCEKIIVKTNRNTTDMWVTKDFKADFYKYLAFFQNSFELVGLSEERIQGFPLASVTTDNSGRVISSYELISVTLAELTPDDFTVPAEYKNSEEIVKEKK